ncbi:MAG: hypothetical protein C0514_03260 [Candidatus Puniceispirillum sp.]|nr:hypothetical protein [Candidatus Puniceispirillum sp.]
MHSLLPDVDQTLPEELEGDPEAGFSLLELSLVLAVMGVVAASGLSLMTNRMAQAKERVTRDHQELLFKTLANYALSHNHLPCPSATLTGIARDSCGSPHEATGYLPFQTLGISSKSAKDGWGRLMHYAVHPDMARTPDEGDALDQLEVLCAQKDARFSISSPEGDERTTARDPVAVVLYSQGSAFGQTPSITEQINSAPTLSFVDSPLSENTSAPHRHLLTSLRRDTLLSHHGQFSCPGFVANRRRLRQEMNIRGEDGRAPAPAHHPQEVREAHPWGGGDD